MFSRFISPSCLRASGRIAAICVSCVLGLGIAASQGKNLEPAPTPAPDLPSATLDQHDATRLLIQATFGPTDELIAATTSSTVERFVNSQARLPITSHVALLQQAGIDPNDHNRYLAQVPWWQNAVNAPDQLRQRVAFALSEIMVVSAVGPGERAYGLSGYMDVLCRDAFGNFRQLLEDVTLSPEMGTYLNLRRNDAGSAADNTHPNENFAREAMQLFTIGLDELNRDGTPKLDANGQPIPTYTQDTVTNFARVFTGWNVAPPAGSAPSWRAPDNWLEPMVAVPGHHDTGKKTLLHGFVIPAGGTAGSDLAAALDNIANHPNVGPFFCKLLIKRLVTSNPTPGYVYRVASVFNDDGHGHRGNLKAVVTAILSDYEARSTDWAARNDFGKLREPVIRVANVLRAFHATASGFGLFALSTADALAQAPLDAPSVFNFFQPGYTPPGLLAQRGLAAPEFQITSESTAISSANYLHALISGDLGYRSDHVSLDYSTLLNLADDPAQVTSYLNELLMAGQMSRQMQTTLTTAIGQINPRNSQERVSTAVEIVVTSPEFAVQK